jgi:hypothetical protein
MFLDRVLKSTQTTSAIAITEPIIIRGIDGKKIFSTMNTAIHEIYTRVITLDRVSIPYLP